MTDTLLLSWKCLADALLSHDPVTLSHDPVTIALASHGDYRIGVNRMFMSFI